MQVVTDHIPSELLSINDNRSNGSVSFVDR